MYKNPFFFGVTLIGIVVPETVPLPKTDQTVPVEVCKVIDTFGNEILEMHVPFSFLPTFPVEDILQTTVGVTKNC